MKGNVNVNVNVKVNVNMKVKVNMKKGVRYFNKGIFPIATSQVTISQVATSQMCNLPGGNIQKVRLGPIRRRRLQWGPSVAARMS